MLLDQDIWHINFYHLVAFLLNITWMQKLVRNCLYPRFRGLDGPRDGEAQQGDRFKRGICPSCADQTY